MTYVQKGFISNTRWPNNTPGATALLGELSDYGRSFAREKGMYSNNTDAPDLVLTTFISKDNTTSIVVPPLLSKQMLVVAQYIYSQTQGGQIDIDPTTLLENLINLFAGVASDFQCGQIITDNVHALPEWLSWKSSADPAYPDNYIKLWFVDSSFQTQYDEFEIYVIPPLDNLDDFFLSGTVVRQRVESFTQSDKTDRIQAAKEGYPEAIVRTSTYNYFDPLNPANVVETDWSVLIYGPAGDNTDSIKQALQDFILAHSTRTREQWTALLPDIFKRTEFILVPFWDNMAIPNRQLFVGIYSPQVNAVTAVAKVKQYATQYPPAHIDSQVSIMGHPYRSISIGSIGSPDNRNAKFKLQDIYPDLIAVTSTSPDFAYMSLDTQLFATTLANMLVTAETMTDFSTVPIGMMKVHRDGILYLTKSQKNVNYLMVAKSNFPAV